MIDVIFSIVLLGLFIFLCICSVMFIYSVEKEKKYINQRLSEAIGTDRHSQAKLEGYHVLWPDE